MSSHQKPQTGVAKSATPATTTATEAAQAHRDRKAASAPRPKLKVETSTEGKAEMSIDHADPKEGATLIEASFGTTDWSVAEALCGHLAQLAATGGAVNETSFKHALALAQGVQPKDEVEAMIATQMAAVHLATMDYAAKLHRCITVQASEAYERSLTRLSRTFTAQVDALKKYRTKGEQRVVVEHQHVHVYPGGQAVVGTFTQGASPGGQNEIEGQSHGTNGMLLSERAAVLGDFEAHEGQVQGASGEGQERLPVSRGKGRCAKRRA